MGQAGARQAAGQRRNVYPGYRPRPKPTKPSPVEETTKDMSTLTGFQVRNSVTVQIDDELITYGGISKKLTLRVYRLSAESLRHQSGKPCEGSQGPPFEGMLWTVHAGRRFDDV